MSRYRMLRDFCGCGPITAGFIASLNWFAGVPKGRAIFLNVEIEWEEPT